MPVGACGGPAWGKADAGTRAHGPGEDVGKGEGGPGGRTSPLWLSGKRRRLAGDGTDAKAAASPPGRDALERQRRIAGSRPPDSLCRFLGHKERPRAGTIRLPTQPAVGQRAWGRDVARSPHRRGDPWGRGALQEVGWKREWCCQLRTVPLRLRVACGSVGGWRNEHSPEPSPAAVAWSGRPRWSHDALGSREAAGHTPRRGSPGARRSERLGRMRRRRRWTPRASSRAETSYVARQVLSEGLSPARSACCGADGRLGTHMEPGRALSQCVPP